MKNFAGILACTTACVLVMTGTDHAVPEDTCERQRAEFPAQWNDTSKERLIMKCRGHYVNILIRASRESERGTRHLSVAVNDGSGKAAIYRDIIPGDRYDAIVRGRGADLFLRSEQSCFIRGDTNDIAYLSLGKEGGKLLINGALDLLNRCEAVR